MSRLTSWRAGAIVLAAGMLVAACSGGSGGPGPVDSNLLPTGIAGGTSGAHGSKSASGSGKASGSHTASRGASTSGGSSSTSSHHGGGGHTSTTAGHPSTSSKPVDNGCRSSAPPKPSDVSKASITVCPAIGLHDGDTVTITGSHFHPIYLKKPEGLLYMQCDYKGENSNNYGSADCNINILKLDPNAAQVRSDGTVGPLYLKVFTSFRSKTLGAKRMDCTVAQCMVTVAQPVQSDDADNPHVVIRFG